MKVSQQMDMTLYVVQGDTTRARFAKQVLF